MARPTSSAARRLALFGALALLTVGLTGCFTGKRPTLEDSPASTGDPAVDAVLSRLDLARDAVFTADYVVTTTYDNASRPAGVVQTEATRRSVTVGDVRFIVEGTNTSTCALSTGECTSTIDAARISDAQLAPDFFASSADARLRRDASMRVGATTASTTTIAGQPATCVTVPITNRTETYCALDAGPLARLDAGDVTIELTSFSSTPDESRFAPSS